MSNRPDLTISDSPTSTLALLAIMELITQLKSSYSSCNDPNGYPRTMLPPSSRLLRRPPSHPRCRYLSTDPSPPHAYLRPLLSSLPNEGHTEELDGVMSLLMDREETRNALSVRMVGELREGIAKVSADRTARILLLHTPHPNVFCSGADLSERRSMSLTQVDAFLLSLRSLLSELESLQIPTIASIDGPALGGGCELALGCDMRVGGEGASLGLPEAKLGIIPGAGGTQRVTRLVGGSRAMEMVFTGRRLGGEDAERIGLLNIYAQPPTTPLAQTLLLCRRIITSAPLSIAASKKAIRAAEAGIPLEEGLTLERELYGGLLGSEDRAEGLRAFKEKRRARFLGR